MFHGVSNNHGKSVSTDLSHVNTYILCLPQAVLVHAMFARNNGSFAICFWFLRPIEWLRRVWNFKLIPHIHTIDHVFPMFSYYNIRVKDYSVPLMLLFTCLFITRKYLTTKRERNKVERKSKGKIFKYWLIKISQVCNINCRLKVKKVKVF